MTVNYRDNKQVKRPTEKLTTHSLVTELITCNLVNGALSLHLDITSIDWLGRVNELTEDERPLSSSWPSVLSNC